MTTPPNIHIDRLIRILQHVPPEATTYETNDSMSLISLAILHRVSYLVLQYAQEYPGLFSRRSMEHLDQHCRKNAMRLLDQQHELGRVARRFNESALSYAVIKGPQLSRMLYGSQAVKESVDLDIMLVHEHDLSRAHELLGSLGYLQSNLNRHTGKTSRKVFLIGKREVHYYNSDNQSHIDLHVRAGANTYLTAGLYRNFFTRLETFDLDECLVFVLPPEQYFTYLCYHGSLHQYSRLGWLMDVRSFLINRGRLLNYDKVMELARSLRSERSVFLTVTLLNKLFNDPVPVRIKQNLSPGWRIDFLVKSCIHAFSQDARYSLSLNGRFNRFIYLMVLTKGITGRIDLLYGIAMRWLAERI